MIHSPVILLHADDNVVVCRRTVERASSADVIARSNIEIGHKLARLLCHSFPKSSSTEHRSAPPRLPLEIGGRVIFTT